MILAQSPLTLNATVDSVWSGQFVIQVDGEIFEPWGYSTDMAILYLCLRDMAYMLNGTSSQFAIREPLDDRWDFWIIRGEVYTSNGTEFSPIPERWATRSDAGGLFGWTYDNFPAYPEQTLLIGIDGIDEPATTLAVRTIQDVDNIYVQVVDLAPILGFHSLITTDRWHPGSWHDDFVEGIDRILTTTGHEPADLPIQSPEFARLMVRLAGHWVDARYFDSPAIDESVVFPAEFVISYHGINKPVWRSVAPIRPEWTQQIWEWERFWWYPVHMQNFENGLVELTIIEQSHHMFPRIAWNAVTEYEQTVSNIAPFRGYRIIIDPNREEIDNLTLFIGDTPHVMRRFWTEWQFFEAPVRYEVQPADDGGIIIQYILHRWAIGEHNDIELRVYRSRIPVGQTGFIHSSDIDFSTMELLHHQTGVQPHDRIAFEFIDNTAEHDMVYYYSLWRIGNDWHENLTPSPNGNMRVDVNEILGEPEVFDAEETEEPEELEDSENIGTDIGQPDSINENTSEEETSGRSYLWLLTLPVLLAITLVWLVIQYRRSRRR